MSGAVHTPAEPLTQAEPTPATSGDTTVTVDDATSSAGPAGGRIPRRHLEAFVLLGLRRLGTSYGYELFNTVRARGLTTDLAGVYRALRSLDHRNLVAASWSRSESGPDRRLYSLTEEGFAAAEMAGIELVMLRDALNEAIAGFDAGSAPGASNACVGNAGRTDR